MSTLLIRNIDTVVTCDEKDRVLHNADLFIRRRIIDPSC